MGATLCVNEGETPSPRKICAGHLGESKEKQLNEYPQIYSLEPQPIES